VLRGRVARSDRRGNATLGVPGVAGTRTGLRENQDVAGAVERGNSAQGRNPASDYQEIGLQIFVIVSLAVHPIHIGPGVAGRLTELLDSARVPARRFIVSNSTVWRIHEQVFTGVTPEDPILIPDGERFKNLQTIARIYDSLIKARADRSSAVIAIGGGVLGDTAGFAAATFLRGVPVVQVPTTLLAQVDSAIGGKVGVNHAQGKNLIGAFHQPAVVAIDPSLLETLPRREFRAGMYEVIKYGVIASGSLFERLASTLKPLFARDPAALLPVIRESCDIKAEVVTEDEREQGRRRILNFGHTTGHALEAVTRYRRFRHGEAVAYGMLVAAEIAVTRGMMSVADRDALSALITKMGPLPAVADIPIAEVLESIAHDKKVVAGKLHFVLPTAIGSCEVVTDVTKEEIGGALTRCYAL
jgi:3-dehydroquinate synthase